MKGKSGKLWRLLVPLTDILELISNQEVISV